MSNDAQRYPIDFDTIQKGDMIPAERVAEIIGVKQGTYEYQFKLLALCKEIKRGLWARGKQFTVRIRDQGIAVLTDAEASTYNTKWFNLRRVGMGRSHEQLAAVDTSQLDPEQAVSHNRNLLIEGATLAAIAAARREIIPIVNRRQHPMLPGAVE